MKTINRLIAALIIAGLAFAVCLTGCQSKREILELPHFEMLRIGMGEAEVDEILGEPYDVHEYPKSEDGNVLGYDYDVRTYKIKQNGNIEMRVDCFVNTENDRISFASFDIAMGYYGENGFTDGELERLAQHSLDVREVYTEMLGEPEITKEDDYIEYTWHLEDGSRIYLIDGYMTSSYSLELWWNFDDYTRY